MARELVAERRHSLGSLGPVEGVEVHVGLAYYAETLDAAKWDVALWDTPAATWAGVAPEQDVTCDAMSVATARGRDMPLGRFRTGTATIVLDDPEGNYSPWRVEPGRYNAIRPGIGLRVWAVADGVEYPIYRGTVETITDLFPFTTRHEVQMTAVDGLAQLASSDLMPYPEDGEGETSGARITRLCDAAQYTGAREFDAGTVELQATTLEGNTLNQAGAVCDAELGALFVLPDGTLRHLDRVGMSADEHYTTVQAIFGEEEPELCYSDVTLIVNADQVANLVTIGRKDGVPVTVTDSVSIALYGQRTHVQLDLPFLEDADANQIAQSYLDVHKDAAQRIEALVVQPSVFADLIPTVLELDVLYLIELRRRAEGFQVVAQLQIQGVAHNITPDNWSVGYATFSASTVFRVARWDVDRWDTAPALWGY